ncbi:adenosine receptor A1-like [Physella acuta]|uniref:adenosine receptor A1-like n=1 Tax=Physella acuta TaxID=109671 RepID=UPI0027DBBDE2|nr:adenosine receptor A1-like [Physella acuta]
MEGEYLPSDVFDTGSATKGRSLVYSDPSVQVAHLVFTTAASAFIPIIILSNMLVIWAVVFYPSFFNSQHLFHLSLAVFHLLSGTLCLPLYILMFFESVKAVSSNKYVCLLKHCSVNVAAGGSLYSLFLISLDRYIAVLRPSIYAKWMTVAKSVVIITALWLLTWIRAFIPMMGWHNYDDSIENLIERCDVYKVFPPLYIQYVVLLPGVILLAASTVINVHIFFITKEQKAICDSECDSWTPDQLRMFKLKISSLQVSNILLLLFLLCWMPYFVISYLKICLVLDENTFEIAFTLAMMLCFANAMLNAPMYAAMRNDYRAVFAMMVYTAPWRWPNQLHRLFIIRNVRFSIHYESELKNPEECFQVDDIYLRPSIVGTLIF